MRIHFIDLRRPKFVAKQVRDGINMFLDPALPRLSLSDAQRLTARMFGYRDWHELDRLAGSRPASPHDEDCESGTVEARRLHQTGSLHVPGIFPEEAAFLALFLKPTSRRPGNMKLLTLSSPKAGANVNVVKAMHEPIDLSSLKPKHMLVIWKSRRVHRTRFFADPPNLQLKLRREDFLRIPRPPQPLPPAG